MSLALPICILFISLMKSANKAQSLNTTSLSLLSEFAASVSSGAIIIAPWTSIYATL